MNHAGSVVIRVFVRMANTLRRFLQDGFHLTRGKSNSRALDDIPEVAAAFPAFPASLRETPNPVA